MTGIKKLYGLSYEEMLNVYSEVRGYLFREKVNSIILERMEGYYYLLDEIDYDRVEDELKSIFSTGNSEEEEEVICSILKNFYL